MKIAVIIALSLGVIALPSSVRADEPFEPCCANADCTNTAGCIGGQSICNLTFDNAGDINGASCVGIEEVARSSPYECPLDLELPCFVKAIESGYHWKKRSDFSHPTFCCKDNNDTTCKVACTTDDPLCNFKFSDDGITLQGGCGQLTFKKGACEIVERPAQCPCYPKDGPCNKEVKREERTSIKESIPADGGSSRLHMNILSSLYLSQAFFGLGVIFLFS